MDSRDDPLDEGIHAKPYSVLEPGEPGDETETGTLVYEERHARPRGQPHPGEYVEADPATTPEGPLPD